MIRIGVPSKGRLMQDTFDWFGARGVGMRRSGADREYAGAVEGVDGVALVLLSAGEIPRELAAGRIHLGVTGSDLVCEELGVGAADVVELQRLGFGQADLIIAVPSVWIDVETVDDLDAAAAGFRAAHGHRLRIATKYHRLVRDFLQAQGVADYQLVDSQGATEGTVKNGTAEAIADITSSGETLRANHLRILSDGLIHQSEAVLWGSRVAEWTTADKTAYAALVAKLGVAGAPF
jgi:ATP phosphoribosyltransferase